MRVEQESKLWREMTGWKLAGVGRRDVLALVDQVFAEGAGAGYTAEEKEQIRAQGHDPGLVDRTRDARNFTEYRRLKAGLSPVPADPEAGWRRLTICERAAAVGRPVHNLTEYRAAKAAFGEGGDAA